MATFERVSQVPEDNMDDLHPSRLLLSATVQVDSARSSNQPTDYSAIHRGDPHISKIPLVQDASTATGKWIRSGRPTPGEFFSSSTKDGILTHA
jgi:hypothetical protein